VKTVTEHAWRYSVVGGDDEGMALYARKAELLEPYQAGAEWNAGKLDALVMPDDEVAELLPHLQGAQPKTVLSSERAGRYKRRYFLLVRPSAP
jgi:hypothetical protein